MASCVILDVTGNSQKLVAWASDTQRAEEKAVELQRRHPKRFYAMFQLVENSLDIRNLAKNRMEG